MGRRWLQFLDISPQYATRDVCPLMKKHPPMLSLRLGGAIILLFGALALLLTSPTNYYNRIDVFNETPSYLYVMIFLACAMMFFGYLAIRVRFLGALGLLAFGVALIGLGTLDFIEYHLHTHDIDFPTVGEAIAPMVGPFYVIVGFLFIRSAAQGIVYKRSLRWI
jgi:hypothetical protein